MYNIYNINIPTISGENLFQNEKSKHGANVFNPAFKRSHTTKESDAVSKSGTYPLSKTFLNSSTSFALPVN